MKQRMMIAGFVILAVLMVWLLRLFWLQTFGAHQYSRDSVNLVEQSVRQRMDEYILDDGRARFVDRDGRSLGGEERQVLIVFPHYVKVATTTRNRRLCNILRADMAQWQHFLQRIKTLGKPLAWSLTFSGVPLAVNPEQVKQLQTVRIPGIAVASRYIHANETAVARHIIGAVNDKNPTDDSLVGVSGLERAFNQSERGVPLRRLGWLDYVGELRMVTDDNSYFPLQIVTTLDARLQRQIETEMESQRIAEGAVVVLDREHGDVIVMASRPHWPGVNTRLPGKGDWQNHAIQEMTPGSIFKIVTATAALAEGVETTQSEFVCNGALGKYKFVCWRKSGHGKLTFADAFAQSCNLAFADIASSLTSEMIADYARRFGLGRPIAQILPPVAEHGKHIEQRLLVEEQAGHIFAAATNRRDEGVTLQTAIGQRDVLVTPLQAANMVLTILNNGQLRAPRIVSEIRYRNGQLRESYSPHILQAHDPQLARVAPVIRAWMRQTVIRGTASALNRGDMFVGGKTGTAQIIRNGEKRVNQWFVGFGPQQDARYAIAVVVEAVHPHRPNLALPLTARIMEILANQK